NDNIACTTDTCDVATGCVHTPVDITCNDNIACTTDTCDVATGCAHIPVDITCNDNIACTTDTCNAATGCVNTPIVCPPVPNGTPACMNGICGIGSCNPGFADCDNNP